MVSLFRLDVKVIFEIEIATQLFKQTNYFLDICTILKIYDELNGNFLQFFSAWVEISLS